MFDTDVILKLGHGVWMRNAVDNCLWADLGGGAVVVDALEDRSMCAIIPEDVEATSGQRMRWVVNTHADTDHITCNGAWADMGATIIGHESVREAMGDAHGRPDITFRDRYVVEGEREEAHLEWVGGAHSVGDTLVWFPWAGVLHVGDLFLWGLVPMAELTDTRCARLCEVMRRVLEFEAEVVVCGHGPVLTPGHIRRFLEYFETLRARVAEMKAGGMTVDEIHRAFPAPEDMRDWWRFRDWKHRQNVDLVLKSLNR